MKTTTILVQPRIYLCDFDVSIEYYPASLDEVGSTCASVAKVTGLTCYASELLRAAFGDGYLQTTRIWFRGLRDQKLGRN